MTHSFSPMHIQDTFRYLNNMALRNHRGDGKRISDDCLSSSTLKIVLDDRSLSESGDEYSSDQPGSQASAGTTGNACSTYRQQKELSSRDPKSHRLIEKRRRDRMNACLSELLTLTPHEIPENQRRIEKTEIIEMAIKHIRQLEESFEKTCKNIESYRTGYRNGLSDIFDFIHEYSDTDEFLNDFTLYLKEKDINLDSLTVVPEKKRAKYLTISNAPMQSSHEKSRPKLTKDNEKSCVISQVGESRSNDVQSSNIAQQTSSESPDSNIKVPIFVLHPSGTHYIPMSIDSSVVCHAFKNSSTSSGSSSGTDQAPCHPISIPVNFNSISTSSDQYELDIQNINVIATRHQTSVRPN